MGPYERRAFPLTLRSDGGNQRKIVGHAAVSRREYNRAYYLSHRDELIERQRKYNADHTRTALEFLGRAA